MRNAFWDFRMFDVYTQCFPDSLHMADTGVFEHILLHVFDNTRSEIYSCLEDGEERWKAAMDHLELNLLRTTLVSNEPISNFVARVGHRITERIDNSTLMYKASEFRRLMMVVTPPPPFFVCTVYCIPHCIPHCILSD